LRDRPTIKGHAVKCQWETIRDREARTCYGCLHSTIRLLVKVSAMM
jgi:hypothetical protein